MIRGMHELSLACSVVELVEKGRYDVIFADPCMGRMIPGFEGTFIPLTHFAVSGKLNV